jgi:glycogen(starch) synthase
MKLLFWCELFPPSNRGGVELFGLQLIRQLQCKGFQIEVICDYDQLPLPPVMLHEGIVVRRFPIRATLASKNAASIVILLRQMRAAFIDIQPDIVHMNSLQLAAFLYLKIPERHNSRMVLTLHDSPAERVNQSAFQQQLAVEAKSIIAVSDAVRRRFCDFFPGTFDKLSVVWNGLQRPPEPDIPMPDGPLRLFSAGRVVRDKGFDMIPDALAMIEDDSIRWALAGDGKETIAIQDQCSRLKLLDRVSFLGRIPLSQVYSAIDQSHLVVMPSRWEEPFGLVALQGAQRARPVLASRIGGLPEIILEGRSGLMFEPDNVSDLARVLSQCLKKRNEIKTMGIVAKERAQTLFSFETMACRYEKIFRGVMAS